MVSISIVKYGRGIVTVYKKGLTGNYQLAGLLADFETSKTFTGFGCTDSFKLVAAPSQGWKFSKWCKSGGSCPVSTNFAYTDSMLGQCLTNMGFQVYFTELPASNTCTLTVGPGGGFGTIKVYKDDALVDTLTGSKVYNMSGNSSNFKMVATPATGYVFEKWCDESGGGKTCLGPSNVVTWSQGCNSGSYGGNRIYRAYFLKQANIVQLEVKRVGEGKINVYRNSGYIGQVSNTEQGKTFNFESGDSVWLEAYPTPGTQSMFSKWCGPQGCSTPCRMVSGKCAGDLKFTISSNQTGTYARTAHFTASHKVCENDTNTGIGVCRDVVGAGTDECQVAGNTCQPNYHNECKSAIPGGTATCQRVSGTGTNTCTSDKIGQTCTPRSGLGSCLIKNPVTGECILGLNTVIIIFVALVILLYLWKR